MHAMDDRCTLEFGLEWQPPARKYMNGPVFSVVQYIGTH